MFCWIQI